MPNANNNTSNISATTREELISVHKGGTPRASKTTDVSTVNKSIKAQRQVKKAELAETPKMTKAERLQLNKDRQAERLAKQTEKLEKQRIRDEEKAAIEAGKQAAHNAKLLATTQDQIAKLERKITKRTNSIAKIDAEIQEKEVGLQEAIESTELTKQQWAAKTQPKSYSVESIDAQIALTESKIVKMQKCLVKLNAIKAKRESGATKTSNFNLEERTKTRESYLESLKSGINSRNEYKAELQGRQTRDVNRKLELEAFITKMNLQ